MIMRSNQSIGEIIRYFRLIKNISQKELSEYLNVTDSAVSSWERALSRPGIDIAIKLAHDMQMSLEEFFFLPNKINAESNKVELFETLKISRCYFDVISILFDSNNQSLRVDVEIRGMTIDAKYIKSEINLSIEIEDQLIRPYKFEIYKPNQENFNFSPELESIPFGSTKIRFSYYFKVDPPKKIKFNIQENGHRFHIVIEEVMLSFIFQDQSNDQALNMSPSTIDEITKAFLYIFKTNPEEIPKYLSYFSTLEKGHD